MANARSLLVVCLCAAWCDACGEFRDTFARLAAADSGTRYVWLDIEDDSALVGDVEVENFPTLAVFREGRPLFYGVSSPLEGVVARTVASLARDERDPVEVPSQIARLPEALAARA
jgi:thioredoxin reductase (NADPH)